MFKGATDEFTVGVASLVLYLGVKVEVCAKRLRVITKNI